MALPVIPPEARATHLRWLHELTALPTAAGKEQRVIRWIRAWVKARRELALAEDSCGNLHIMCRDDPVANAAPTRRKPARMKPAGVKASATDLRPVYFTAHLDHPAFVVERVIAPGVLELSFRGGVMADYFPRAAVTVFDSRDRAHHGLITSTVEGSGKPFKHYLCELDDDGSDPVEDSDTRHTHRGPTVGDVAIWRLPAPEIIDGCFHTVACDDLAAAVAALAAFDVLLAQKRERDRERRIAARRTASPKRSWKSPPPPPLPPPFPPVRLLFTRAEEIGFVGAIGAARAATVPPARGAKSKAARTARPEPLLPRNARILALENSRSFPESPIGGGPIVRVGDRISVFTPALTDAVARRAEQVAGGASTPTASQKLADTPKWKWQRKLMAGGACEASVFCNAGFDATCVCLPLGNYHNMADLAAVQAGTHSGMPAIDREFISVDDFEGLVDLLVACGLELPDRPPLTDRFEKLWNDLQFVL